MANNQWSRAVNMGLGVDIVATSVQLPLATTAELASAVSAVNTVNKVQGAVVYNTDTDNPVYAAGPASDDIWVDGIGSTVHSP